MKQLLSWDARLKIRREFPIINFDYNEERNGEQVRAQTGQRHYAPPLESAVGLRRIVREAGTDQSLVGFFRPPAPKRKQAIPLVSPIGKENYSYQYSTFMDH